MGKINIKTIIIILSILFIGLFISQSIYWFSFKQSQWFEELVNEKDLTQEQFDKLNARNNNYFQQCLCSYESAVKVHYVIKQGTFPFTIKQYSKDSIFYPIITKPYH